VAAQVLASQKVSNYILLQIGSQVVSGVNYYFTYSTNIGTVNLCINYVGWTNTTKFLNFTILNPNLIINTDPSAENIVYGV
jgi:hypothetical protein